MFRRSVLREIGAKSVRVSLWVAIPVILALTALASSFLTFELIMRMIDGAGVEMPRSGRHLLYEAGWKRILGMATAGALIGTLLSYALMGPIRAFRRGAMEVARGNLARAMDIGRDLDEVDEVSGIGTAFHDMLRYMNRYIVDSMSGGVMTIDVAGRVTSFNVAAEIIFGYEAAEVLGRPVVSIIPDVDENRPFLERLRAAIERKRTTSSEEVAVVLPDGRRLEIGVTLSHLTDGTETILGVVITFKDLGEITRVRNRMRQSEQLAALGSLAAGVAHELRNPLGSLQVMTGILEQDLGADDPKREITTRIGATIGRLDRLVSDLLTFAQPGDQSLEWTDLRELMQEAAFYARHEFADREIECRSEFDESVAEVCVDREKMFQALLNLVRNAYQATPAGGTVTLRATAESADRTRFVVHNTGSYIPPEHRTRLFHPFFTTRPDGTGLGLPITHWIVQAHGGEIRVASDVADGTTFEIVLPIVRDASGPRIA